MPHWSHEKFLVFKNERDYSCYQVDSSLEHLDLISATIDGLHLSSSVVHDFDGLNKDNVVLIYELFFWLYTYMADQEY